MLNRAVGRMPLFERPSDYDAFVSVISDTWRIVPLPIFAMTLMPNHWHFVVRPEDDTQVQEFFRRLTVTHTMRWHAHHETSGTGHLYQGRFKSFPVATDEYFLSVIRYVERNALRACLVSSAVNWRWSSAWYRQQPTADRPVWLCDPIEPQLPCDLQDWLDAPQSEAEAASIGECIRKGSPFGSESWVSECAVRLGLVTTMRRRGRPRNSD
ncbi:transposase [Blastopirellula sp. JC732]|uniref:Transposase n=1 Tax=Blastopirellula sediminis TaxID=2894196 RepID=A0A9X1MJ67_9BACT|nr:transposase [Blastopirellula sediminis]MCC9609497.1 transposase [Blastopirellula sediminis]MCC9627726.1 transposase [Blastopirellula sediminis]